MQACILSPNHETPTGAIAMNAPTAINISRPALQCSEEEWRARVELAACYRLSARFGMTDLIYTHISARVPGHPSQFLVNPNGLLFEEITASNLVKIDLDGNILQDTTGLGALPGGYNFHSAVYVARADVACAVHTHTAATIAVGAQKGGLLNASQHAMRFHNRVAYYDYPGFVEGEEERRHVREALSDKSVLMLRNHGLLVVGKTIHEAFILAYYVENACRYQVAMQSCNVEFTCASAQTAEMTAQAFEKTPWAKRRDWPALLRMLDRDDPSYAS
jgi:ribulose-5-phosphate 4-epimerase/fuculose-1-phosphate aldolase